MTTTETERAERTFAPPPRESIRRTTPFMQVRAADQDGGGDGLTLDGYAAVFNTETIIDSWEGRFKEVVAPGSMKKSFRENPPRIQFDHGYHPLIGSIPIASNRAGYPREEVDPERAPQGGAHVIGDLHDNWLIQPVRDAIASETIDGMSFRFTVIAEQWRDYTGKLIRDEKELHELLLRTWLEEDYPDEELPVRTLKELRVPELGPVVWPAYTETSVGVRSLTIDLARLNDPEQRSKLAQAVILADRADHDDEAPGVTADQAAEDHAEESDDTPQTTARSAAGTHESASVHHSILAELERIRAVNIHAESTRGRYA